MTTALTIRGAGGGGKSGGGSTGHVPVEAPETLRSESYARVLDLLCEGEIEGLVDGMRSIFLDGTPLQDPTSGLFNFTGITYASLTGTQGQLPMAGFDGAESEHAVSTEVKFGVPIVRTITDVNVDAVRVRLSIPGLSLQDTTTGDLNGTSVQIAIDIQANGGGYVAQKIGFGWQNSATPATVTGIAIIVEINWTVAARLFASILVSVEYRVVGAGSWTVMAQAPLSSGQRFTGRTFQTIASVLNQPRTFSVYGLADALYEVRAVKLSGSGTVAIQSFKILTHIPSDTITGKTTTAYQRSYRLELTGSPPWDVRVRRITADSTSTALRNKTFFETYAEIIDTKFSYPNTAVVGINILATQFSSIPTRGYDVKLLRVKIPSNYDPLTRVYTGIWDGTFVVAWTDNPAWCFYDLLTNTRYGLGQYLTAAQVDKWALYTIGVYCDGLVPDGAGSTEPRLTCNLYLQTQQEAFQVLVTMASIFRGMAYWASGSITAVQDAPADPVFLFTEANVENGMFHYSGTAKNVRHTVALVSWNDPEDGYKLKPEYVEDVAGIARYGVVSTSVVAVGAISRSQAHRLGAWLLYSEQHETEVVTFRCGQEGIYARPGSIVAVQDQHRAGIRYGGRIVSATASSVTLDSSITIVGGQTYTLQVVLPDGTLDTKTVTNTAGAYTVLTLSTAYAMLPVTPAVWLLTSSALSPRLYRVLSITEVERQTYEITGLAHNPLKFDAVELGLQLTTPSYSTLTTVPAQPQNFVLEESLAIIQGIVKVVVTFRWDAVPTATRYVVQYRRDSGNYVTLPETSAHTVDLVDALPGFYEARVVAWNILSAVSPTATASRNVLGKTAPPANVTGFVVARTTSTLNFAWLDVADLDLSYYEIRRGATWEAGVLIGDAVTNRLSITTNLAGTYLIKAFDTTGNQSVTAAVLTVVGNSDINVVVVQDDATTWLGTKVQTASSPAGVTLTGSVTWSALTGTWDSYTSSWFITSILFTTGTYETLPVNLGVLMVSRVEIAPVVVQIASSGIWLDFTLPWLSYQTPWTGTPGIVGATYEMAISLDGVAYGPYQPFLTGHYSGWAFKFRITITTSDVAHFVPLLTSFPVTIDVPDRVIHFEDQATVSGGTTITFTPLFVNVQTVTGTIQSGVIGDTFRVTSKTNSSAVITVYDSAGVAKAGVVDLDVFGYGSI